MPSTNRSSVKYSHVRSKVNAGARAPSVEGKVRQASTERGAARGKPLAKPTGTFGKPSEAATPKRGSMVRQRAEAAARKPSAAKKPLAPLTPGRKGSVKPPVPRLAKRAPSKSKKGVEQADAVKEAVPEKEEAAAAAPVEEKPALLEPVVVVAEEAREAPPAAAPAAEEGKLAAELVAIAARLGPVSQLEYVGRTRYPNHLAGGKRPGPLEVAEEPEAEEAAAEHEAAPVSEGEAAAEAPPTVLETQESVPMCVSPTTPGATRATLAHLVSPMSPETTGLSQPTPVCLQFGRTDSTLALYPEELGALLPCALEAALSQPVHAPPAAIECGVDVVQEQGLPPADAELPQSPQGVKAAAGGEADAAEVEGEGEGEAPAVEEAASPTDLAAEDGQEKEEAVAEENQAVAEVKAVAEENQAVAEVKAVAEENQAVAEVKAVAEENQAVAEVKAVEQTEEAVEAKEEVAAAQEKVEEKAAVEPQEEAPAGSAEVPVDAEPAAGGQKRALDEEEEDAQANKRLKGDAEPAAVDVDAMSHRQLQKECKRLGLKASGKSEDLRSRLLEAAA